MPGSLSPTQAKTFLQCPLQWWFGSVARWRTPPTRHTLLGNVVHAALEDFYGAPPEERTRSHVRTLLSTTWQHELDNPENAVLVADSDDALELEQDALSAVEGLWELEVPHEIDLENGGREEWVTARIKDAPIGGRIDRHTNDGVWRISDYKTGRVPAPAHTESALFGMWTYAAAMAVNHPEKVLPDEVELLYVGKGVRIRRPVVPLYLRRHARTLNDIWSRATTQSNAGELVARRSALCDWCNFRSACPLYSGRSTPTPGTPDSDQLLLIAGNSPRRSAAAEKSELLDELTDAQMVDTDSMTPDLQ